MKRFFLDDSIDVFSIDAEKWDYPLHNHNFYELIMVGEGSGLHIVNQVSIKYESGDIFLLSPDDSHTFEIAEKTKFNYLKFTEQLLKEKVSDSPNNHWREIIEQAIIKPNTNPSDIISYKGDREKLHQLFPILQSEFSKSCMFSRQALLDIFGAMMSILARNLNRREDVKPKKESTQKDKVESMLSYIRKHIDQPEKISIGELADTFHISPNYVSIFVKKHAGISIQQMIMNTKMRTAERLVKQSSLTLSEISSQLGFTDASHFNKTFKKYKGKNPKDFRLS